MMRLVYSPRSLEDFDEILRYVAKDNASAAVKLGEDLLRTCELLEANPLLGKAKEDLASGLRRIICRGYGVYYRADSEAGTVWVVRFLPPRMNVTPALFR